MKAQLVESDRYLIANSIIQIANKLGLSRRQLANTIGVSVPTVARMKNSSPIPSSKPLEIALQLIRIYRALYAMVGGDQEAMRHWLGTANKHFSEQSGCPQVPIEMIQSTEGLIRVMWYLDAIQKSH